MTLDASSHAGIAFSGQDSGASAEPAASQRPAPQIAQGPEDEVSRGFCEGFIASVRVYKPWHEAHWYGQGKEAFSQIANGAVRLGFLTPELIEEKGWCQPGNGEGTLRAWQDPQGYPQKHERKKVWSHLKKECQALNAELYSDMSIETVATGSRINPREDDAQSSETAAAAGASAPAFGALNLA